MNQIIIEIFSKLAPIFILIGLGIWIRYIDLFRKETVDDFKKLIINISLPAILFFAFLNIDLKFSYIFIFIIIFILCIVLYLMGLLIKKIFMIQSDYLEFLTTGFEFGMMGAVFFGAAFGMENIGYIGLIGLGHEFFIWFVYVTLLKRKTEGQSNFLQIIKNFISSPVIIAIILGLLFNILNLKDLLESFVMTKAVFQSLNYLAGLTVPLILIIIGYNIRFEFQLLKKGIPFIITRLTLIIAVVIFIDIFIFQKLFRLDKIFSAALYTFVLLPPPFILPLYIKKDNEEELSYVNGVIVLYSLFSIIFFSLFFVIYTFGFK
jgi:predicted permease